MSRVDDVTPDRPDDARTASKARKDRPRGSQVLVWGGIGLAAVATALAARAVVDALSADPEDRPRRRSRRRDSPAPRFADLDEQDRSTPRARARAEFADSEARAASRRETALQDRSEKERLARRRHRMKQRRSFLRDFSDNAVTLATNITSLIAAANAAVDGFQQVSGRTGGIMRDFTEAADKLRGCFDPGKDAATPDTPPTAQATPDDKRSHRL